MATRTKKISIILGVLALLILALLVALPYGIQWAIVSQLEKRGADEVSLAEVNFNPFKGVLVLHDLEVQGADGRSLSALYSFVDLDWHELFQHRIRIRKIELNNAAVGVRLGEDNQWYLDGIAQPLTGGSDQTEPAPESDSQPWTLSIDTVSLTDTQLHYAMPDWQATLRIDDLEVREFSTRSTAEATQVRIDGRFNDAPLKIQADLRAFADQPEYRLKTELQGLDLTGFSHFLPETLQLASARLSDSGNWVIRQTGGAAWSIDHQGALELNGVDLTHPELALATEALKWDGDTRINLSSQGETGLSLSGTLTNNATQLTLPAQHIAGRIDQLQFDGKADLASLEAIGNLQLDGRLSGRGLSFNQTDPALTLAQMDSLELQAVRIDTLDRISLDALTIRSLVALSDKPTDSDSALVRSEDLQLAQLALQDQKRLTVDAVDLGVSQVHLERTADGQWRGIDTVSPGGSEPQTESGPGNFTFAVNRIKVAPDSQFEFTDNQVDPPYHTQLDIKQLTLSQIDSGKPAQPSKLNLNASAGKYASLSAEGTFKPFGESLDTKIAARIARVELPPLSPYIVKVTGYSIHSGTLTADSNVDINAGELDIKNQLHMEQLTVKPVDAEQRQQLEQSLSMPLDKALDMLRDSDDNIELDLPITGSLANPNFDASDAINQALGKALKTAAVSYIKYALQPYGALLMVGQLVGDKLSSIQLEPIPFAAGEAQPAADQSDYLARIGKLMGNRPELNLKLCGLATEQDRQALQAKQLAERAAAAKEAGKTGSDQAAAEPPPVPDDQLLELAEQRAYAMKDRLIHDQSIATGRLFTCNPEIDKDAQAQPRVDLRL